MSSHLTPARSDNGSSRVSHILPTVKCSSCSQSVPLSSLGAHVCSPQQPPPSPSKHQLSSQREFVPRLRSDSQSVPRPRPSFVKPPGQDATSHVPFPTISTPPPRPEDYMPGGESGMAGVGRRAFQAAAHAAIFAHHHYQLQYPYIADPPTRIPGSDSAQFLDITGSSGRGTPPLSPNSAHSSPCSHSPHSPLTQSPTAIRPTIAASRTPSPAPSTPMSSSSRSYSNPTRTPPPRKTTTPTSTASKSSSLQKYRNTLDQEPASTAINTDALRDPHANVKPPSSPTDSDFSDTGLAYDRADEDEEDEAIPGRLGKDQGSSSSRSAYSAASLARILRDDIPGASPRRSHTTPTSGPRGGPGGVASPLGSVSPPGAGAARSASDAKTARRVKETERIPTRRVCIRCERSIENGRWIKTDIGKGVLCERCWKNMYLPKCRRCDKPIEQAAVFSSDGQLKGKYHRECFNCATCHKPFPDKSFYVYGGQPMCAFHYHQANRSLCVSPSCGRPIEGACAITFVGDRYHPNCLRCGHAECDERLEDYWEIDGMMLCERHAQRHEQDIGEEEDDQVGELGRITSMRLPGRLGSGEVRKRTTRLINLAGAF